MNLLGTRNAQAFSAEPDIKEWANGVALNPSRVPAGHPGSAALDEARGRLATFTRAGAGEAGGVLLTAPSHLPPRVIGQTGTRPPRPPSAPTRARVG